MYNKSSAEVFQSLDNYLSSLQDYWQFEAFHHGDYPWEKEMLICASF
ncbi:hypothetical protein ACLKMH_22690 [Psychromonas sp. KJ10-10]